MTIASHTATTARSSHSVPPATWIFPGRIDLSVVVNWQQASMEAIVRELKIARAQEDATDSALIAGLRHLSAECAKALATCATQCDAASGRRDDGAPHP